MAFFEDLEVWQDARTLAKSIYELMSDNRDFGFRDQIQRAAVSIMNNIAEGSESGSNATNIRFLNIAKGSCAEVRSMLYLANDLDYAQGIDLDTLGQKCDTIRPQATKSSVTLEFTLASPLEYDYTIPENTIVSTNDGISYYTTEDCTIIRGEYETTVGALSVMNGGNSRVEPYTLTECDSLNSNCTVTNPQSSSGNHETYTDEEYRELLRNWTYSHIRGTKEAYEEFFANYDGLDDYRLIPKWDGAGTLKIITKPYNDWIRQDLSEKLAEHTYLLIEDVLITGAIERALDIDCTINIDIDSPVNYTVIDYNQTKELVERALRVYVNGGYRRNGT